MDKQTERTPMNVIPSETIYGDGNVIIPMADVQHIEKKYYSQDMLNPTVKKGDLMGISVIMKSTRWNMEHDFWDNPVWIGRDRAEDFIRSWCYYRYEVDGIKELMKI